MNEEELNRIYRKIRRLSRKGKFSKKKIYLFGESINTRRIIKMIKELGAETEAIIDNDVAKQGGCCYGKPIVSLLNVENILSEKNLFIIYSSYWREMLGQLKKEGVSNENIILMYKKKGNTITHLIKSIIGKRKYFQIKQRHRTDNVYLCPYTGTGDIYLIGTFWKEYCKKNNIVDYVFVVITDACMKVAMLCEIENVELLKRQRMLSNIISAHMLWPDTVKLKILNDCWPQIHTNQIEWFRGYKGLEFMHLFRKYVFDLSDLSEPEHPNFKNYDGEIDKVMKENGLISGKTVILSPYSNTLLDMSDCFWEELAKNLKQEGFCVCTNIGDNTERAINETIPIFFKLTMAPQFVEKAGYFVGIRSGFCDVISGARATKIILYDKRNRFYAGSAYEYFNLKDMKLCDDALEIEYDNIEEIIDVIIKYLTGDGKNGKKTYSFN